MQSNVEDALLIDVKSSAKKVVVGDVSIYDLIVEDEEEEE